MNPRNNAHTFGSGIEQWMLPKQANEFGSFAVKNIQPH